MKSKVTWACLLGSLGAVFCVLMFEKHGSEARPAAQPSKKNAPQIPKTGQARESLAPNASSESASWSHSPGLGKLAASASSQRAPKQSAKPTPPFSLTTSDGTGLQLVSLSARAAVEGPLALTELQLSFENPRNTTIEGRFEITLPSGATISRFAMKLPGGWQEAEVVERQAARQTYESYLHVRRDPALLEKKAGNTFRARVFPIPPGATKQIIVGYSQQLASAKPRYRLALRGLPKIATLSVDLLVGRSHVRRAKSSLGGQEIATKHVRLRKKNYKPRSDFLVDLPAADDGLRHKNIVVARIKPDLKGSAGKAQLSGLVVLIDTSASRAGGLAAQTEQLSSLLKRLARSHGDSKPLVVAAFDQGIAKIYEGTLGGFDRAARDRLISRRALGASNLYAALRWAGAIRDSRIDRLLLISDGIASAGPKSTRALRKAARKLSANIRRLDVLLVGGQNDREAMQHLARGTRRRAGVVVESDRSVAEIANRLTQRTFSRIEVHVKGARWVWPSVLEGLQVGDSALVYADVRGGMKKGQLAIRLDGAHRERINVQLTPAARPLLQREWVRARIERLEHRHATLTSGAAPKTRLALKKQIIALSTKHRVLSDHTAMIVLESEAEYRRFKISRRALANVLSVGPFGVKVVQRKGAVFATVPPSVFPPNTTLGADARRALSRLPGDPPGSWGHGGLGFGSGEAKIGLGTLGTIGKGGGGGSGYGGSPVASVFGRGTALGSSAERALGSLGGFVGSRRSTRFAAAPARRPAWVRSGSPTVGGPLDRAVIRLIIRRHLNEVRYCYQRELQAKPGLGGRVLLGFTIASTGKVVFSKVLKTTLRNPGAEACVAKAVKRWLFPKPRFGIVIVKYPFTFRPGTASRPVSVRKSPFATNSAEQKFVAVRYLVARKKHQKALEKALAWHAADPTHMLALLAAGEALQANGHLALAARVYGSLIDLYPSRAEMRRYAAQRLDALGDAGAKLALDAYQKALEQRPDHVTGYRLLAWCQARQGDWAGALATLERAFKRKFPSWRDRHDWKRVLREDAGLVAASLCRNTPHSCPEVAHRAKAIGARIADKPSLRFVLSWETDANDVDLYVRDKKGHVAYYGKKRLPSGGRLYGDVTNGFGPELFVIPQKPSAYPYRLGVRYFSRGPSGYGFGTVSVIQHDGKGKLRFSDRPFVALDTHSEVSLGRVKGPL
jgi:tetratricopeptide (TPR) repeat protein